MACFDPVKGFKGKHVSAAGKRPLVFNLGDSYSGVPVYVPCGKCIGCRKSAAQSWAIRCMHEQRCHGVDAGSFVTLTYDDNCMPPDLSVSVKTFQLWMKRLRKLKGDGIRFFGCGEYGSRTLRPHYHVLLFNVLFGDARFYKQAPSGFDLFRSDELSSTWSYGFAEIGGVTPQSAGYVAKYMVKDDVLLCGRAPPFRVMSRRPGLGTEWFSKYGDECFRHDDCVFNQVRVSLPRFYDGKMELLNPELFAAMKERRRLAKMEPEARYNNTTDRRRVRERFEELSVKRFARET